MSTKEQGTRNLLLEFACFLSLAISVVPIVDYYSPWMITMIPVALVLLITLQKNSNVLPTITFLILFAILGSLHYLFLYRSNTFAGYLINFIIAFLPCLVAYQVRSTYDRPRFFKNYLQTFVIFTGITSITTIIGLNRYPMASRELASGSAIFDTDHYRAENIGGYEYIYALVILIPLLVYLIHSTEKLWRFINVAILIVNILCVYESQYTTALILTAVVFLLLLALKNRVAFGISVAVLLAFWLFGGLELLSRMFLFFSEKIGQEYVADRLLQLSQLFGGGKVSTETSTERLEHYQNQLSLFFKNPLTGHNLFGYNSENISGHSFVLDWLGGTGVLGFGIVTLILRTLYVHTVRFSRNKACKTVKLTWLMIAVLAVLNPVVFPLITTLVFTACSFLQGYEESLQEPEITKPNSIKEESKP